MITDIISRTSPKRKSKSFGIFYRSKEGHFTRENPTQKEAFELSTIEGGKPELKEEESETAS